MKITFSYLRLPSRGAIAVAVADARKLLPTAAKLDRSTGCSFPEPRL